MVAGHVPHTLAYKPGFDFRPENAPYRDALCCWLMSGRWLPPVGWGKHHCQCALYHPITRGRVASRRLLPWVPLDCPGSSLAFQGIFFVARRKTAAGARGVVPPLCGQPGPKCLVQLSIGAVAHREGHEPSSRLVAIVLLRIVGACAATPSSKVAPPISLATELGLFIPDEHVAAQLSVPRTGQVACGGQSPLGWRTCQVQRASQPALLAISRYPKSTIGPATCMTRAPVDSAVTRTQIELGRLNKSVVSYDWQLTPLPLEKPPDPRSCFAAIALIGVVWAGTTASPREVTPPISLDLRSANDFGIGVGHGRSTYLICEPCAIISPDGAHSSSPYGTPLPHLLGQPVYSPFARDPNTIRQVPRWPARVYAQNRGERSSLRQALLARCQTCAASASWWPTA